MSEHNDDLLDRYLDGNSDLSDLYHRSDSVEPERFDKLDSVILAAAKKELGCAPQSVAERRALRWLAPLSAAATVVISASLYLINQPDLAPLPTPMPQLQESGVLQADRDRAAPSERPAAELKERHEREQKARQFGTGARLNEAPAGAPSSALAPKAAQPIARPNPPRAPISSQVTPTKKLRLDDSSEVQRATQGSASATVGDGMMAKEAPGVAEQRQTGFRDAPERWLQQIRALLAAELWGEAEDELAAFRQRYPDYPLPETLQAWLDAPLPRQPADSAR